MIKPILNIIKIGGDVINDAEKLTRFLDDFSKINGFKILVHGGGKRATELAKSVGLEPKMVNGRRITDEANLDVVTMVYAGLINKNIVAQLQKYNCNALGLTGADANIIKAHKRIVKDIDYGFAGDIDEINSVNVKLFLENNIVPVFCAITHDKNGQLLNTNADTIASEIASGLAKYYKVELTYCFEKNGVLRDVDDDNSVIEKIDSEIYEILKKEHVITDGMLPKLENCFNALQKGVAKIVIGSSTKITNKNEVCTILTL